MHHGCANTHINKTNNHQQHTYRWQKPRIILALYIMSAAISMRRIMYMLRKYLSSSSFVAVTWLPGGSTRCVLKGVTCRWAARTVYPNSTAARVHPNNPLLYTPNRRFLYTILYSRSTHNKAQAFKLALRTSTVMDSPSALAKPRWLAGTIPAANVLAPYDPCMHREACRNRPSIVQQPYRCRNPFPMQAGW